MKVNLFALEKEFAPEAMAEAGDLLRQTRDFRLLETERNHFLFTSVAPDYQVEVVVKTGNQAAARCDCAFYKRNSACKHALAACVAVRDLRRKDRASSRPDPVARMVDEVLRKLGKEELKALLAGYAATHESFRIELLAAHLHRTAHPDYGLLLQACVPTDRHGKLALNRKTTKSLRTVVAILLQQTQESLQAQDAEKTLGLLEGLIPALYRFAAADQKFRELLQTDIRTAQKWFDTLFKLPLAPRLQQRGVALALDTCSRDSYFLIPGVRSMLEVMQPFMLEAGERVRAVDICTDRLRAGKDDPLTWAAGLVRSLRLWPETQQRQDWPAILAPWMPELIRFLAQQSAHEDILFAWRYADPEAIPTHRRKPALVTLWQAARTAGDAGLAVETAAYLVVAFRHMEAFDWLLRQSPKAAEQIITDLDRTYPERAEPETEHVIVYGLAATGHPEQAWRRLEQHDDVDLMRAVEGLLQPTHGERIEGWYAAHITRMRDMYGGKIAREKLSHIFSHLKTTGRYERVRELTAMTEKKTAPQHAEPLIRGFVFDLDGVIVDTAIHHFDAWRRIMRELGAEIRDEDDRHTRGASRMESFNYLLDTYGVVLSEADKLVWADRKNALYLESIANITPRDLLPGAGEFLQRARAAGLRLALGSASKNARSVLDRLGIADRFDAIVDGNDVTNSKPDPEVFLKACLSLGLAPESVVVFEDAAKGLQAAIAAGCHTVGIGEPAILGDADIVVPGLHATTPDDILERIV